jgi:CDP-glycerol glycerophosphotransferase (TagB/SpsB family)
MRDKRRILVDARTRMNYAMFAPVHAAMRGDSRLRFAFISSEDPSRNREVFADAGGDATLVGRLRAAMLRYDAYITSDFTWTKHVFSPVRIQMFHGVGGKYGFDAPAQSLRPWKRLFFVNRRRLENCIRAGAIEAGDPAIRLIGMPKVDCLVDGTLRRDQVLSQLALDPSRPTVLYAPTWSPASSLNTLGLELVERLRALPINVVIKLHDRSHDPRPQYSGGVDWRQKLAPFLEPGRVLLADAADICPYMVASDVMITDHSSSGFEYLLLDRPVVRIHIPELITLANIHPDYVALLTSAAQSVHDASQTARAIEIALAEPEAKSATRRAVAAELFHRPGSATDRCAAELYEAVNLQPVTANRSASAAGSTVGPSYPTFERR